MRPPSGKVWGFSIQWWVFFYASSIAYKVLNTWPVLLFMRYMDLPRIRSTKYSFLDFHQRVEYSFPRSYMSIKIQTKEIMMLRGKKKKKKTERYSLLGKLKSASYQNVSLEKIIHGFNWPPIYLILVSWFLMPLTHCLEECIQQATLYNS